MCRKSDWREAQARCPRQARVWTRIGVNGTGLCAEHHIWRSGGGSVEPGPCPEHPLHLKVHAGGAKSPAGARGFCGKFRPNALVDHLLRACFSGLWPNPVSWVSRGGGGHQEPRIRGSDVDDDSLFSGSASGGEVDAWGLGPIRRIGPRPPTSAFTPKPEAVLPGKLHGRSEDSEALRAPLSLLQSTLSVRLFQETASQGSDWSRCQCATLRTIHLVCPCFWVFARHRWCLHSNSQTCMPNILTHAIKMDCHTRSVNNIAHVTLLCFKYRAMPGCMQDACLLERIARLEAWEGE